MTERFTALPSPFDSVDIVSRLLRWWVARLDFLFEQPAPKLIRVDALEAGAKRLKGRIAIVLDESDIFVASVALPAGAARHHRNAIDLKLSDIAPKDIGSLDITAQAVSPPDQDISIYAVAMARKTRLDQLERMTKKKGGRSVVFRAENHGSPELVGPSTRHALRRAFLFNAMLGVAACATLATAAALWTARIEKETRALDAQASSVRRAALMAEIARRDSKLAKAFVDRGVLDRRPGVALKAFAEFNRATPDGTWWTSARWTPTEITISGESSNAAEAIKAIATDALHWSVELAGPIKSDPTGVAQTFELRAQKRAVR
jgi:hypothetical protein